MIKFVIKRDGRKEDVDMNKVVKAVNGAAMDAATIIPDKMMEKIIIDICNRLENVGDEITVEELHVVVENTLLDDSILNPIGKAYKEYRMNRDSVREKKLKLYNTLKDIAVTTHRENANVGGGFSAKMLQVGSAASKWANGHTIPKIYSKAHDDFDVHIHDLDSYYYTLNCLQIPTGDALASGFDTGYGRLKSPKRITTAASLSCILLQSSQNSLFGGQSHDNYDNDLAPYVELTRKEIMHEYLEIGLSGEELRIAVEKKVRKETLQAGQITICNLNSMAARAGAQVPFSSLNIGLPFGGSKEQMDDAALVCEGILLAFEEGIDGKTPIFPNLIFRVKDGVNAKEGDPYYWLFQLACRVASKRMNPTFLLLDNGANAEYYKKGILGTRMGCRTNVMANINGEDGSKSRGNNFPITINLPKLALRAKGNIEEFYKNLDEIMELCESQLMHRYDACKRLKVKDIPFSASEGLMRGSENLSLEDSIEPIMKHGTMGIGMIGLAETLVCLTGKHHGESKESNELGLEIVKYMRAFTDKCTQKHQLNFSLYYSPSEGTSGRFTGPDRKQFGNIAGVTDKEHYTNSMHVPVDYKISIADKIKLEAEYHKYGSAGNILYVELDNYPDGATIEEIVTYARENSECEYIAINFHIRQCKACGEFVNAQLCECHKCGCKDIHGVSRITGYLALDERFNPGKIDEKKRRVSHTNGAKAYRFM